MKKGFFGETQCVAIPCKNRAYYVGQLCGRHCKKGPHRKELPKNPKAKEIEAQKIKNHVNHTVTSEHPHVIATKMKMMKKPIPHEGYILVCPNNRHGHNYGYPGNYSGLSPMRLGPVEGGLALNIENYHQFAKVFPQELSDEECECGRSFTHYKALPAFYETRKTAYADPEPHRHKFTSKGINIPKYSVQFIHGEERHFTYVESRFFYCTQMELLATQQQAFIELLELFHKGYSIDIHGYDAYNPDESLYTHYCDPTRPFGHELVILALLVLDTEDYPWKIYKREHENIYDVVQNKKIKEGY